MTIATRLRAGTVLGAWACVWACAAQTATMTVETVTADGRTVRETRPLEIRDGRARFVWPRAAIPPGAKSVALKPDFATAKTGEAGYWVFPNNTLGRFHETDGRVREGWHVPMPMYGLKTPRATFCAIVTGMPHSLSLVAEARKGAYCVYALFDRFMDDVYEDIAVEYTFLTGDDADYSGIARRYRAYQLGRGACRPIAARVRDQPLLAYAARHPEVRIRQAWKPVPSPVPDQVTRNEPPVRPVVTFDRVKEIVDECRRQGVDGAEFCLVGWNVGGHDGRFPQIFPVEPSLGGEAKLRRCIKDTQDCGYLIVPHANFRDAYRIAENWDIEYLIKNDKGEPAQAHSQFWGGGRQFQICPQRAWEFWSSREMPRMAALGFRGMGYFDVVTILLAPVCNDPRHPLSRAEAAAWWGRSAETARAFFGGFASEGSLDHFAGSLDSVLYASFGDPRAKNKGLVDGLLPVWQLVYNGIIVNNPFTTTVNFTAQDRYSRLKLLEYGGRPNFYFYSKFVDDGTDWMGKSDLGCATDEELRASVAKIKAGWDIWAPLSHLQFEYMRRHARLAADVFLTEWEDGTRLVTNYRTSPYTFEGRAIPAEDYLVLGKE